MKLSNTIIAKSKYKASSKFDFWNTIEEGDDIYISMNLKNPGSGRSGLYATRIDFLNRRNNMFFVASLTETARYLSHLEYTEQ